MFNIRMKGPYKIKRRADDVIVRVEEENFSIVKEGDIFQFLPLEGCYFIMNAKTLKIKNLEEIFVFRNQHRIVRISLNEIVNSSTIEEYLGRIVERAIVKIEQQDEEELNAVIRELELQNVRYLIDKALIEKNETLFYDLMKYQNP